MPKKPFSEVDQPVAIAFDVVKEDSEITPMDLLAVGMG